MVPPAPSATSLHDAELGGAATTVEAGGSSPDFKLDKWTDSVGSSPEPKPIDSARKSVGFSEELDGKEEGNDMPASARSRSRLLKR